MNYSIVDIEAFCARFWPNHSLLITPFAYSVVFATLPPSPNGQASQTITIAANADFVATGFRHRVSGAANIQEATQPVPSIRMLVTDSGSNEQFTNTAVELENYSSARGFEKPLPYPRIINGRTTLTVAVENFSTTDTYNQLEVMINGVLVRAYSR